MTGQNLTIHRIARFAFAAVMTISVSLGQTVTPAAAAGDERALYLYYTHTGETARVVFKRNGQYVQSGLDQMNHMLRDWRKNQPTKMDPHLFDLVWEVYREVGATQPINIVSGFRSPTTNEMLRSVPGSGVAENSQHTKGHAMDFFIPGVPLTKLRATAMRLQVGGVGYYPTSGSPFVHLDTGTVRAWPRMTRAQLAAVFPDGKTLHLPADGKPLSNTGRAYAMAQWTQCHSVPCNGPIATGTTRFASNDTGAGKSLADMLFGGKKGEQAPATIQVASVPEPALPPTPMQRPANLGGVAIAEAAADAAAIPFSTQGSAPLTDTDSANLKDAPTPALKSQALLVATAATLPANKGQETALTALAAIGAPVPASRVLMTPQTSDLVTAYAPAPAEPGAELALRTLIARNADTKPQTAVLPPLPGELPKPRTLATSGNVRTASLGGTSELTPLVGLFDMTWGAVEQTNSKPVAAALATRSVKATTRNVDLVAPDLEHVAEVFLTPEVMTSDHYAVIYDHDEADFSPMTELGPYVTHMGVGDVPPEFSFTRFVMNKPLAVALR